MNTLQRLRAALQPGVVLRVLENTKRPELNGSTRVVTRGGVTNYRFAALDQSKDSNCFTPLPSRVGDVTWQDDFTVKHAIAKSPSDTVTLRLLPAIARTPERIAEVHALRATPKDDMYGITWYGPKGSIAVTGFVFKSLNDARIAGSRPDLVDPAYYSLLGGAVADLSEATYASIETPNEDLDTVPVEPPLVHARAYA